MKKKKKVSLFWCLGNLEAISSSPLHPHIHSAASSRLKATLSHEHSLGPLLSDGRGGEGGGGRGEVIIKAEILQTERSEKKRRRRRQQSEAGGGSLIRSERKEGREQTKTKSCQSDGRTTVEIRLGRVTCTLVRSATRSKVGETKEGKPGFYSFTRPMTE